MFEDYIKESLPTDEIDQSDIFRNIKFTAINRNFFAILITPVCDIINKKVEFFNFCAVLEFEQLFFKYLENKLDITEDNFKNPSLSNTNKGKIKDFLVKMVNNQYEQYHWLGKLPNQKSYWYIDFQLNQCISVENLDTIKSKKVIRLKSPLKESVFVRFSNYMGRVGLPGNKDKRKQYANNLYQDLL